MKSNSTKEKMSIIWFIPSMVKKTGRIYQKRSRGQELRSLKYLWYHKNILIVLSKKKSSYVIESFVRNNNSVEKSIKIQQTLYFSFLKNQG